MSTNVNLYVSVSFRLVYRFTKYKYGLFYLVMLKVSNFSHRHFDTFFDTFSSIEMYVNALNR